MADEVDTDYDGTADRLPTIEELRAELRDGRLKAAMPRLRRLLRDLVVDLPDGGWAVQVHDRWYRLNEDGSPDFDRPVEVGDSRDPARLRRELPPFPDSWMRG